MVADGKGRCAPDAFLAEQEWLQWGSVVVPIAPKIVRARKSPDAGPGSTSTCFLIGIGPAAVSRPVACPAAGDHDLAKVLAVNRAGGNEAVAILPRHITSHGLPLDVVAKIVRGFLKDIDGAASPPAFRSIESAETDPLIMDINRVAIHHRCDPRNLGASCDCSVRLAAKRPVSAETNGQDKQNNRQGMKQTTKARLRLLGSAWLRSGPLAPAVVRIEPDDISIQRAALCLMILKVKAFANPLNQPERPAS